MARMRLFVVLLIALTAGGVLAFATYNYVNTSQPSESISVPTRPVVVAAADLGVGAEIRQDRVRVIQWPAGSVPEGATGDPKDLIGRGVILPIVANEPILPNKLSATEAGAGLPPAIPPGLRAVSVRVNEVIGVAGYVVPGTRVDVVATVSPTQQQQDMTSKVILPNVQVLAAGTRLEQDANAEKPMPVSVVTLLVNPEESERLTLAATEGKIQLALRNPLDQQNPATPGIRPATLLGTAPPVRRAAGPSAPRPAPHQVVAAGPPSPTVEIIRGDKREQEIVR
jgi:pilus assembly protein CpaB